MFTRYKVYIYIYVKPRFKVYIYTLNPGLNLRNALVNLETFSVSVSEELLASLLPGDLGGAEYYGCLSSHLASC